MLLPITYLIGLDDWYYQQKCGNKRIDTVRLKLLKIAAKIIRSARYITFKLCSSCPYKNEFYETLSNIGKLNDTAGIATINEP